MELWSKVLITPLDPLFSLSKIIIFPFYKSANSVFEVLFFSSFFLQFY